MCDTRRTCRKLANPTRRSWKGLKKAGRYLKGVQKVTWMMQAWESVDGVSVDAHVDSDWAKRIERKSTSGAVIMIKGTVVKHWSRTQRTRGLSTAEAEFYECHHWSSGGSRNAVGDDGRGRECTGSYLDGLHRSQSDCVKKRPWAEQTCGIEMPAAAGGGQIGKRETEAGSRRANFGGPFDEGKIVSRGR